LLRLGPEIAVALAGTAIVELAWLAHVLGRESELLAVLARVPTVPWTLAARAVASGDFETAAPVLAGIGCRSGEAYTNLRAAQGLWSAGRTSQAEAHLEAALVFYREVGATHFIREGMALRAFMGGGESAQGVSRA
jgi:hypothetical protein